MPRSRAARRRRACAMPDACYDEQLLHAASASSGWWVLSTLQLPVDLANSVRLCDWECLHASSLFVLAAPLSRLPGVSPLPCRSFPCSSPPLFESGILDRWRPVPPSACLFLSRLSW